MKPFTILGREPALWLEVIKAGLMAVSVLLLPIDGNVQAAIVVILVAVTGVAKGLSTSPFHVTVLTDAIQTIGAAVAAFGFDLGPEKLATMVMVVGALSALIQRSQISPDMEPGVQR